jgi:hypothetical protein
LSTLVLKSTNLLNRESGQALANALKGKSVLTHLDVSGNCDEELGQNQGRGQDGPGFAQELAIGIKDSKTLLFLDISGNNIGTSWYLNPAYEANNGEYKYKNTAALHLAEHDEEPAGGLGPIGVIAIANAIKGMGTLSVLSLKKNRLGTKDAGEAIGGMLKMNTVLKELDLSYNSFSTYYGGDAIGFAKEVCKGLVGNEAISSLNLANNSLGQLTLPAGWSTNGWKYFGPNEQINELSNPPEGSKPVGVIPIVNAIKYMGAMTKLDVRNNSIDGEGKRALQQAAGSRYVLKFL